MPDKIAVVVSTYNSRDVLSKVLDAYGHQTRLPDELIVADDGSSDGTDDMVAQKAKLANFPIRYVWQEDKGFRLARIRNLAVKNCTADYLLFTDGDCIPHPCLIEDHLRIKQEGFFVQGKRMNVGPKASRSFEFTGTASLFLMCLRGDVHGIHHLLRIPGFAVRKTGLRGIKTANFAIYRSDFIAVNGFNEDFIGWGREDSELVVRLYKYGLRRKDVSHSAIVFHLWHESADKSALVHNDLLLKAAIESPDYRCAHGIINLDWAHG